MAHALRSLQQEQEPRLPIAFGVLVDKQPMATGDNGKTSAPAKSSSRTRPAQSNPFKLINCDRFDDDGAPPSPFHIDISVEALAIVDFHAHCVETEVIGLLGGVYCQNQRKLTIMVAEPCRSIADSNTELQCEMDPESQFEAIEKIEKDGHRVVGWYHSHPTFVPNPSIRDIETQSKFQSLFQDLQLPFIALILSPYSSPVNPAQRTTLRSNYKCLMVSEKQHQAGYQIPYEFETKVVRKDRLNYRLNQRIQTLVKQLENDVHTFCMSDRIRGKDMTLVDKMVLSMRSYLQQAGMSEREADEYLKRIKPLAKEHFAEAPSRKSRQIKKISKENKEG